MQTIHVEQVTLHKNHIAAILCEMKRQDAGAVSSAAFHADAVEEANRFIRLACEQAAGKIPAVPAPATARPSRHEMTMQEDQGRALEILERLAEGGRFIVDDERMGRALQYWVDRGYAAQDEEGYFLTPAGRTYAEEILG